MASVVQLVTSVKAFVMPLAVPMVVYPAETVQCPPEKYQQLIMAHWLAHGLSHSLLRLHSLHVASSPYAPIKSALGAMVFHPWASVLLQA